MIHLWNGKSMSFSPYCGAVNGVGQTTQPAKATCEACIRISQGEVAKQCPKCKAPYYRSTHETLCQECHETEMLVEGERQEARRQLKAEESDCRPGDGSYDD